MTPVFDSGIDGGVVTTTEDHPFWNQTDHKFERADALAALREQITTQFGIDVYRP